MLYRRENLFLVDQKKNCGGRHGSKAAGISNKYGHTQVYRAIIILVIIDNNNIDL
jgi:hypothetical protein